jgi:tRNA(fMet)-specific endonuclease VapC
MRTKNIGKLSPCSPLLPPIGPNDLMIAAIVLANGLILVTHNTREFSRVSGLALEDWQVP